MVTVFLCSKTFRGCLRRKSTISHKAFKYDPAAVCLPSLPSHPHLLLSMDAPLHKSAITLPKVHVLSWPQAKFTPVSEFHHEGYKMPAQSSSPVMFSKPPPPRSSGPLGPEKEWTCWLSNTVAFLLYVITYSHLRKFRKCICTETSHNQKGFALGLNSQPCLGRTQSHTQSRYLVWYLPS